MLCGVHDGLQKKLYPDDSRKDYKLETQWPAAKGTAAANAERPALELPEKIFQVPRKMCFVVPPPLILEAEVAR